MAEVASKRIDRRDFIRTSLGVVGGVVAFGVGGGFGAGATKPDETRWAFLADTHIPGVDDSDNPPKGHYCYNPHGNLQEVVRELVSDPPDGVVIIGDLARLEGKPDDYVRLKELLEPLAGKAPVFKALGNHDDRGNYLEVFKESSGQKQSVAGRHVVVVERECVRLILLDSLFIVNKASGLLGREQRQWLGQYLESCDDRPVILCVHHSLGEGDGELLDAPRLLSTAGRMRKVKAIIYGHSHVYRFSRYRGVHLINVPAVGYSFNKMMPVGWVEARLTRGGGLFRLHTICGNKEPEWRIARLKWR
jgi:Icc protein